MTTTPTTTSEKRDLLIWRLKQIFAVSTRRI